MQIKQANQPKRILAILTLTLIVILGTKTPTISGELFGPPHKADCQPGFIPTIRTLTPSAAATEKGILSSGGTAYALLVGINNYNSTALQDLHHPVCEVDSLAKLLVKSGYVTTVLTESSATRTGFLQQVRRLVERKDPNDRILFYFAGHGLDFQRLQSIMNPDVRKKLFSGETQIYNEAVLNGDKMDFLILGLHQRQRDRFEDAIGAHQIADMMNDSKAHQKILVFDTCYSGSITDFPIPSVGVYSPRLINDGLFVITGAKKPVRDGDHSPFLFAGLLGAADKDFAGDCDGYVSVYELAVFMDTVLKFKYKLEKGVLYKIRYVQIGSGEVQLYKYLN